MPRHFHPAQHQNSWPLGNFWRCQMSIPCFAAVFLLPLPLSHCLAANYHPLLLPLLDSATELDCARGRPGALDVLRCRLSRDVESRLSILLAADEVRPNRGRCTAEMDTRVSIWGGVPGDASWLSPRLRLSPRLTLPSADCALTGDAGAEAACRITCWPGGKASIQGHATWWLIHAWHEWSHLFISPQHACSAGFAKQA